VGRYRPLALPENRGNEKGFDMAPSLQLTVQCRIVGHASPRWKGASTESLRVANNEALSRRRADAVMEEFKPDLIKELGKYRLKFLENVSYADDNQPNETAVIGSEAMGQRDSLLSAGGNKRNDDAKYRRTDVTVRIARSTQDEIPTKVERRYERTTKSKFWYVSVGVAGSVEAVVGFGFMRIKLRNWKGDEASGSIATAGCGASLKYSFSPYSWTEEASFTTDKDVGFDDFHGTRVRYTNAGLVVGIGYSRSWLTFWGMGRDAASLQVGGWQTGAQASLDLSEGILILDTVPADYKIERYDETEWNAVRSDWITEQKLPLYFDNAQWALVPDQVNQIRALAAKVAKDIRAS
jgi:hypothetical protein